MNEEVTSLINALPEDSRIIAEAIWEALPSDMRQELGTTLSAFSKMAKQNPMAMADLIKLVRRQADPALRPVSDIAILGPVNSGKSTLFNALLAGAKEKAEVSSIPGTTKVSQTVSAGLFNLADTPGLDNGGKNGTAESEAALQTARSSSFIIMVFDATRGITASDRDLYLSILALGKPMLIALNKFDLIKRGERRRSLETAANALGVMPLEIHQISALKKEGIEHLLLEAAAAEPRLLGEMGRQLPQLRRKLSWQAIRRAGLAACAIAVTPLPVIDLIPLTALQISLVLTLARIHDKELSWGRAAEITASFGTGLAARTLFQELSKLGGPPGWALSASIAGAVTIVIGYSVMLWFESGIKPSAKNIKAVSREVQKLILNSLSIFGKKRPNRQKLSDALDQSIPDITLDLEAESFKTATLASANSGSGKDDASAAAAPNANAAS